MIVTPETIHVVDDDPSFRVAIARLLQAAGYQVVLYESGQQLLANPPGAEAGCMLLDIRMPEVDGIDVQERCESGHRPTSHVGQKRTHARQQTASLFDQFVGAREDRLRDTEMQIFCCVAIDDQFECRRLLHR